MKLLLNLKNENIKIIQLLNFNLWELLYTVNKDIIIDYLVIDQTSEYIEYIFQYAPISFFPSFYSHMRVSKKDEVFTSTSISSPIDEMFVRNKKCVKIETMNDHIQITGTDHNINIEISFDLSEESQILEPAIKNIFKKMFQRVKEYIESM
jgi:hypothetical protein